MQPRFKKIKATILLLIVGLVMWQSVQWYRFLTKPMVTGNQPIIIVIQVGTPLIKLAWDLKQQELIIDPKRFIVLARIYGATQKIKAGEYSILPGTQPITFLKQVMSGKVIFHNITFIEGWTFNQLLQTLNNNPYLTHTITNLDTTEIMAKLDSANKNPEGLFYPDTYRFSKGATDLEILWQAYRSLQIHLNRAWQQRSSELPYTDLYQALIVASLIEKETAVPQERSLIAGVILRRLQKNMLLQIDASVIYGLGAAYTGNLTRAELSIPTPYNTYLNAGLPPTPIAMPSASAISAALHPVMTNDALYYVATGNGSHIFSATFAEHEQAAKRYWLLKKANSSPQIATVCSFYHSANKLLFNLFNIGPLDCTAGYLKLNQANYSLSS